MPNTLSRIIRNSVTNLINSANCVRRTSRLRREKENRDKPLPHHFPKQDKNTCANKERGTKKVIHFSTTTLSKRDIFYFFRNWNTRRRQTNSKKRAMLDYHGNRSTAQLKSSLRNGAPNDDDRHSSTC